MKFLVEFCGMHFLSAEILIRLKILLKVINKNTSSFLSYKPSFLQIMTFPLVEKNLKKKDLNATIGWDRYI